MPLVLVTNASPGDAYWMPLPPGSLDFWDENNSGDLYPVLSNTQTAGIPSNRIANTYAQNVWSYAGTPIVPDITTSAIFVHSPYSPTLSIQGDGAESNLVQIHHEEYVTADIVLADAANMVNMVLAGTNGSTYVRCAAGAISFIDIDVTDVAGPSINQTSGFMCARITDSGADITINGSNFVLIQSADVCTIDGTRNIVCHAGDGAVIVDTDLSLTGGHTNAGRTISAEKSLTFSTNLIAWGEADSFDIAATGSFNSVALGRSNTGPITATGNDVMQFGPGTNTAGFKIGNDTNGIRFRLNASTRNGDFWLSGDDIIVRSGGANRNFSNIP